MVKSQTNFKASDMIAASESQSEPDQVTAQDSASTEQSAESSVPTGSVREIMDWVGDDKDRAQSALDQENSKDDSRVSLVRQLEAKIAE